MADDFDALAERLTMTEIVRLQDVLSRALVRRFEKRLALVFSDVVGSTPYFARFGDEAGRQLQQRHVDLVQQAIAPHGGRVVDTAGDGAFVCFAQGTAAVHAMVNLQERIAADNDPRAPEHRLNVRIGVHVGPALTDGVAVSGDSVNFASRVSASANAGEIRLTTNAYGELADIPLRMRSRRIRDVELKGLGKVEVYRLDWHDPTRFPALIRFEDGSEVPLPSQEVVRFGRLREQDGAQANDVVLTMSDPAATSRISRWHFELHLRSTGLTLKNVSNAETEVDGVAVERGHEVPVKPGTKVRVGGVMTLELVSDSSALGDNTFLPG
jgi:class 3 adenylate cyclase